MLTKKNPYGLNPKLFFKRLTRNISMGFLIILGSLGGGMLGYHHFEKMPWIDAYENAAMILSGMGPVATIETKGGKIFAGTYALFSGIVFLVVIAIIFAPVVHRFFHKFHIEEEKLGK
ncbi:MAG: hypothetical protein WBD50_04125 [Candidatus Rhabdochlamydia sp.]